MNHLLDKFQLNLNIKSQGKIVSERIGKRERVERDRQREKSKVGYYLTAFH